MKAAAPIAQYDRLRGVFQPRRRDTLKPSAAVHAGATLTFTAAWIIEAEPYAGQWALQVEDPLDPPLGWVPEEDVRDVVLLAAADA